MKKTISILILILFLIPIFGFSQTKSTLAERMCTLMYIDGASTTPVSGFEKSILSHLGLDESHPEKEKHITKFFNENNAKLICGEDTDEFIRENEHILKRSLALADHNFLVHVANNSKYEGFDWNFYEMVDGKKETILDYIDMILNDEELSEDYDVPELNSLVTTLEWSGAKRGKELK